MVSSEARCAALQVAVLTLLKELVMALPAGLTDSLAGLLPAMEKALSDKASNSNVKIEALLFLRLAMASHPPEVFQTHLKVKSNPLTASRPIHGSCSEELTAERVDGQPVMSQLVAPAVFAAVGERYYKVTSGALRVCVEMIRVVRPSADSTFDFSQYTGPLYAAIEARLTAQDQDAEVKPGPMFTAYAMRGSHDAMTQRIGFTWCSVGDSR
jgi:cullin-associated NEDD8-dissociated protein 1